MDNETFNAINLMAYHQYVARGCPGNASPVVVVTPDGATSGGVIGDQELSDYLTVKGTTPITIVRRLH